MKRNIENSLKRWTKRKNKITEALVVMFLITGTVSNATELKIEFGETKAEEKVEKKFLLFGNFGFDNNIFKKINHNRVVTVEFPENEVENPIERPDHDYDKIEGLKPIVRPIGGFDPLRPEVDPKPIIWKNGKEIEGMSYTLIENLELTTGNSGYALETHGGRINSEAKIKIEAEAKSESIGMFAKGGTIINNGIIEITNSKFKKMTTGMFAKGVGSTAINNETITSDGDGMRGELGATITNNGTINAIPSKGDVYNGIDATMTGMYVKKNSTATNNGTINTRWRGMNAENNSTVINFGDINVEYFPVSFYSGGIGVGASGDNSFAINEGVITMFDRVYAMFGMQTEGTGSIAINNNKIIGDKGKGQGMFAKGGTIINEGVIDASEGLSINTNYENGVAINNGVISGRIGMKISSLYGSPANEYGGSLNNNGTINSNYYGMSASYGGIANNNGIINVESGAGFNIANGSKGTNNGTININVDKGIGINITNGGTGINANSGIINLNANDGIGIKVDGVDSTYINNGTINIKEGTTGNQEIVFSNGATFLNSGLLVADNIDIDVMGKGRFMMSEGGAIEAETIKGNIYASGSLAMGSYEDEYSTYKMLKTNKLEGEIISNSAMFSASFTKNTDEYGYYDVVLNRKDFSNIVENKKMGIVIENNYKDNGNKLKEDYYDALKLISTEKNLNKAVEDTFGIGFYEGFAKQSIDNVKNTRNIIEKNIFNNSRNRKLGDVIGIGGVNRTRRNTDNSKGLMGYDSNLYTVYFGGEEQIAENWRVGLLGIIGNDNVNYNTSQYNKDDDLYQGTFYALYEKDFRVNTMVYIGEISSKIKREVNFLDWNKNYEDKFDTRYQGFKTQGSKAYSFEKFDVEPTISLSFTNFNQKEIEETQVGGALVEKANYNSIELGIGSTFAKQITPKLKLETDLMLYGGLGRPYQQKTTIEDIFGNESYQTNYKNDPFFGKAGIGLSYQLNKSLELNLGGEYRISSLENNLEIDLGFSYLF